MDTSTEMKFIRIESHLNILEREIADFSGSWTSAPETALQRFDDLLALVSSSKALLPTASKKGRTEFKANGGAGVKDRPAKL